jgi:putative membrane protein
MVPWLLAGHVFGLVLWISGLLATTILLRRHLQESSPDAQQALARVERIVLRGLADPGALVTILAGIALVTTNRPYYLGARWLYIKLAFVLIMILLHGVIAMRAKATAAGRSAADAGQAKTLMILVLLVFVSILIATLPLRLFLT